MGNRAIIQTRESYENNGIGVYVHWNGGRDSITAFLKYCELKGYRPPDKDCYGWARLCQVIGNFFGGTLSLGIGNFDKDSGEWQDNGTYIIEGWEIVDRKHFDYPEQDEYDLYEMLENINESMPIREQLSKDVIYATDVPVEQLKIGDEVFIRGIDESYEKHKVVGFGGDEYHNGYYVKGVPYVDLYEHDGDFSWNTNNYIKTSIVKKYEGNKVKR